ncbi:MAG: undecaprenyl-phosphate glucose phosphotransferase [Phycisphaerales bacterium]
MVRERHQFFRTVLILADGLIIMAAQVLAYMVRFEVLRPDDGVNYTYQEHAIPMILTPLVLLALFHGGLYQPRRDQRFWREAWVIIRSVAVGCVLMVTAFYVFQKELAGGRDLSRLQWGCFAAISVFGLLCWRSSFRSMLRALRRQGWNLRHVAIVGTGRLAQVVFHTLERNSWTGIKPTYFISHRPTPSVGELCGLPVRGSVDDIEALLDEHPVSGVFVAVPQRMASRVPRLLSRLERFAIDVRIVPDVNPRHTPFDMTTTELDGMPVLAVRQNPLVGWNAITKRSIDIVGASVALLLFLPVMVSAAIAVRLSGPGPVIFRQPRASLGGRSFMMYKFRTMDHVSHEQQAIRDAGRGTDAWTDEADPRITRVGKLLRRTSLDELPQLLNVLLGEMSLVGPRPERPELIARFREDWRGYMLRQHVKAGITGWAQVNGLRGQTSLRKRLQYDLFYIRHWSLAFDLRILVRTVFIGFVHPNAR